MVFVKCAQTDLPKNQRKSVTDAVRLLYDRIVEGEESSKEASKKKNKAGRLGDYCKALKQSLDNAFQPHWHVMAGESLGFACKNRKQTVGVWHILPVGKEDQAKEKDGKSAARLMVVIWKSPGIEIETPEAAKPEDEKSKAEEPETEKTGTEPEAGKDKSSVQGGASLHVIQPPAAEIEAGSEVETAIGLVQEVIQKNPSEGSVELSRIIRRRLTKELGTIWHVVLGREFVIEPAANRRNFIYASYSKDNYVVCFQHEQVDVARISWKKIISALPWLLVVFVCFGYMMFHNICENDAPERGRSIAGEFFYNKICTKKEWETEFGVLAAVTVASSLIAKKMFKE